MKRLREWWRWLRRVDWELAEVIPTNETAAWPTALHPYYWERWQDKRTGKSRWVACC